MPDRGPGLVGQPSVGRQSVELQSVELQSVEPRSRGLQSGLLWWQQDHRQPGWQRPELPQKQHESSVVFASPHSFLSYSSYFSPYFVYLVLNELTI
jgi:hypothetical protein